MKALDTKKPQPSTTTSRLPHWIDHWGDILFDSASVLLEQPELASLCLRNIAIKIEKRPKSQLFEKYFELQILSYFYETLKEIDQHKKNTETPSEHIQHDLSSKKTERINNFVSYFDRMPFDDRFYLLMKTRHGISNETMATVMKIPEDSLKLIYSRSIQYLQDNSWENEKEIIQTLKSQPENKLPDILKKNPKSTSELSRENIPRGFQFWQRLPWYIRTLLEGTSIVLVVMLGVSVGPKLREFYEKDFDQTFVDFSETFFAHKKNDDTVSQLTLTRVNPNESSDEVSGDFQSDESSAESSDAVYSESDISDPNEDSSPKVHVGNKEIWRFNLKTDSPHELRTKVLQTLMDLEIDPKTPGVGGIEAPGGIQFDILISKTLVADLKIKLEKLAPPAPAGTANTPLSETFTWYKNISRKPIPAGKTRVVIWLSQI